MVSGQGEHLSVSVEFSTFTTLFVGGWNVEKQPFPNGT